jgi:hypothetical protein
MCRNEAEFCEVMQKHYTWTEALALSSDENKIVRE